MLQQTYVEIYKKILINNDIINQYIIISLWFIFNFLNENNGNITEIFDKINHKYDLFSKNNIEEFIHVFILIIAYSAFNQIYEYYQPDELHNKFITIFNCIKNNKFYDDKLKDQTCYILYDGSHYINLIKNINNSYYIVNSMSDDILEYNRYKKTNDTIEDILKNKISMMNIPISFKNKKK